MNECRACAVDRDVVLARLAEPRFRAIAEDAAAKCDACATALAPALDAATRQREAAA